MYACMQEWRSPSISERRSVLTVHPEEGYKCTGILRRSSNTNEIFNLPPWAMMSSGEMNANRDAGESLCQEDPAVSLFREYLRIKTVHPDPDYGMFCELFSSHKVTWGIDTRYLLSSRC